MTGETTEDFTSSLGCLVRPALAVLTAQLNCITGLSAAERAAITDAVASGLYETAHRKACRVLLVELNVARVEGKLAARDPAARWREFLEMSASQQYWDSLGEHYPTLLPRLRTVLARRCAAAGLMADRFAADRGALAGLLGASPGELIEMQAGAGDTHRGGGTRLAQASGAWTRSRPAYAARTAGAGTWPRP